MFLNLKGIGHPLLNPCQEKEGNNPKPAEEALQGSVRESVKPRGRSKETVNLSTSGLNSIVRPSVLNS